jgi:hypothetical protein
VMAKCFFISSAQARNRRIGGVAPLKKIPGIYQTTSSIASKPSGASGAQPLLSE